MSKTEIAVGTLRVVTRHPAGFVNNDYTGATWRIEDGWLLISYDAQPLGGRVLSRVLMSNVVQMVERLPQKTS